MKKFKFLSILLLSVFTLSIMVSCGGDDEEDLVISPSEMTIFCDERSSSFNSSVVVDSWSSEDDFIAKLFAPQKNSTSSYVVGRHIGTTRIKATKGGKTAYATVTVNPRYTLYDTPILDFSASKAAIKSKENHVFTNEDEETLQYRYLSGTHECVVSYLFKENKMSLVTVVISNYDHDIVTKFLSERYQADREVEDLYINAMNRETATLFVMEITSEKLKLSTITYFQNSSDITSK